jgi:uncharacterized protein (DUF1330 family)
MPSYVIAHVKVIDPQGYRKYISGFMELFKPFDGKVLVATDEFEVLEGEWPDARTIVMEFPTRKQAEDWYSSQQYQQLAQHRHGSATTNMILVDGFAGRYTAKP